MNDTNRSMNVGGHAFTTTVSRESEREEFGGCEKETEMG